MITCIKGDDNISNLGCSELNPDKKDATNKINSINNYNFNIKFSEFRVNNEVEYKKHYDVNKENGKNKNNENKENKENQSNNIMKKKSQIKTLIRNINIEDNKY